MTLRVVDGPPLYGLEVPVRGASPRGVLHPGEGGGGTLLGPSTHHQTQAALAQVRFHHNHSQISTISFADLSISTLNQSYGSGLGLNRSGSNPREKKIWI